MMSNQKTSTEESVNTGNTAPGELLGDGGGLPAVPGDAALPEAARRPLRELMDALLDASGR
jgi:hypothetical protein